MRLLAAGGGTGGHVYPALSVIDALFAELEPAMTSADVRWAGSANGIEEQIIARTPFAFHPLASGAVRGAGPLRVLWNLTQTLRGTLQALGLVRRFRPDVILATGGYVSVPTVLAGWVLGRPSLIYLPDMEPGLAVRLLSVFAKRVAVSFAATADHFASAKTFVSGYPVRQALHEGDRPEARKRFGLDGDQPTLLVLGGSRGARAINRAVKQNLEALLGLAQVIHITGSGDLAEMEDARDDLAPDLQKRYHLHGYLHEGMVDALVAADLIVGRAGASALGEFPAVGAPSVLVPYPHAGPNQHVNAEYMQSRGAAVVVLDHQVGGMLIPTVEALLASPERLRSMAAAAKAMAAPEAARTIARELIALAEDKRNG